MTVGWEWNEVGYPTDATLEAIAQWRGDNFSEFFSLLKPVWKYSDMPHPDAWCGWSESDEKDEVHDELVHRYHLSTGGWSGNESLIGAMKRNYILWSLTWVQSRRGGHYIFEHTGRKS